MTTLLAIETSGRQLISNISDQSLAFVSEQVPKSISDLSQILLLTALVIFGVVLGLILGRRRIVSFILVLYLTTAIATIIPFEKYLSQYKIYFLIAVLIILILLFVWPAHFSGNRFWFINGFWTITFGLLSVGLLLTMVVQFSPADWLSQLPSLLINVFGHYITRILFGFLPLLFLWLAVRRGDN